MTFNQDLAERAAKTFLQAFVSAFTAAQVVDFSMAKKAAAAGVIAGLSALASMGTSKLSSKRGDPNSASALKP